MAIQGERLYWLALVGCALSVLTYSWEAGVLGGVQLTEPFQEAMHRPSVTTVSMISSVLPLGYFFGSVVTATLGMMLGRRTWVLLGDAIQIVGGLICATSYSPGQLIAGRAIEGFGNGLAISMAHIYMAEMAVRPERRGRGVYILGVTVGGGSALAYWLDFGMVFAQGQVVWRFPVALQILISGISFAILLPLPDTPRWYYARKRVEEGDDVLRRLCVAVDEKESHVKTKTAIMVSLELEKDKGETLRFKDFFWDTSATQTMRRVRTGMIMLAIVQFQGLSFIFYYIQTVFQKYLALPRLTASALSGALTTCVVLAQLTTIPFLEKAGRRTWFITGACLQTIFLALVTGLSSHPNHRTSAAAAAFTFCFAIVLGSVWSPLPYVYVSELMPLRYRHVGVCLSTGTFALCSFIVVFASPISYSRGGSHGWTTYIWFLVFNAIAAPYVYFFCPETQGKTLEEIDLIFLSKRLRESSAGQKLVGTTGMEPDSEEKL